MGNVNYRPTTETITAATAVPVTHADTVIPDGGFKLLLFENTGANNHLGATTPGIDSVRVFLNGGTTTVINALAAQIRALVENWDSFLGGQILVTNQLRFHFPLDFYGSGKVGIPFGAKTEVSMLMNGSASTGVSKLGWEFLDEQPDYMPRFISQAMGVPASQTEYPVAIKTGNNPVVGFALPLVGTTGITRIQFFQRNGDQDVRVYHATQNILLQQQARFSVQSLITTSFFLRFPKPIVFPPGSFALLDTGAGSAVGDAWAPLELVSLKAPSK